MPPTNRSAKRNAPALPWDNRYMHTLPDCATDPRRWIEVTDKLTKLRFNPVLPLDHDWHRGQPDEFFADKDLNEDVLQEIKDARRLVCTAHLAFSQKATDMLTEDEFETKWMELSEGTRAEYYINAFKNEQDQSSLGNVPEKLNCPELCWDELERGDGQGFLDLMKLFLLDDNDTPPTQPFILVNPRFDEIIGWSESDTFQNRRIWLGMRRMMRTRYIASFLGMVIANYSGYDLKPVSFTHEHHKTKETLERMRPMIESVLSPADSKKWLKAQATNRKQMQLFCANCLKAENKAVNGRMSVCVRCNAMGRQVRYCNRECQTKAWPSHKRECGKELEKSAAFDDVDTVPNRNRPPARPDIPSVAPGYKRSPDLVRLISLMNEEPTKDYIMILPTSDPRDPELEGITLDEIQGAAMFMVMRNKAMRNGDQKALFYVYRVLQKCGAVTEKQLRNQLKREYGKPFESLLAILDAGKPGPAVPDVSATEIDKALAYLKLADRFYEELDEYVPGEIGKTVKLAIQVGPRRDLTVIAHFPDSATPPSATLVPVTVSQSRQERRSTPQGKKGKNSHEVFGLNHPSSLPPLLEGYTHTPALERQIAALQANPDADYILWGHSEAPRTPHALAFQDFRLCSSFQGYRRRLFSRGGCDTDALAYAIMAILPAVRRRKISKEALRKQLSAEYGEKYVDIALDCIKGSKYHRRDGKVFALGEIPASKEEIMPVIPQMRATGRFEILNKVSLSA